MVSCQKDPTRRAYAWQIGPFWQDTLQIYLSLPYKHLYHSKKFDLTSLKSVYNPHESWLIASSDRSWDYKIYLLTL